MGETLSVVIPTHNRAAVLAETLASLREAARPDGIESLEIIVVANACTDGSEDVIARFARDGRLPIRCVPEPLANLSLARNRGCAESNGAIIFMLDDDVRVERDWLAGMLEVYRGHPADLVAGRVTPWWAAGAVRPAWFRTKFERMLSLCDHGDRIEELFRPGDALGANYSFRREVFDAIGGFRNGLGRTRTRLIGGEEIDFTRRALAQGARLFYAPRGSIGHLISPRHVTREYLCALSRGNACTRAYMDSRWTPLGGAARALSGCLLAAGSFPPALLWRALRRESERVACLLRRHRGLGMAQGHLERLLGRSPVDRAAAREALKADPIRIERTRIEQTSASGLRVAADVDGIPVWFATNDAELVAAPEAFVAAFLLPALHSGRGLSCDSPVCAVFARNLQNLAQRFRAWWRYPEVPIRLDTRETEPFAGPVAGTTLCFSGGVDSFHTLLAEGAPRPDRLLFLVGYDIPLFDAARVNAFDRSLAEVTAQTGTRAVRMRSNLRAHPAFASVPWIRVYGGALAAAGHVLGAGRTVISSTGVRDLLRPGGSHPETDPLYGSAATAIVHWGAEYSRAQKLAAIAGNQLVRNHLRVCWANRADLFNCGRCEKCVRTLVILRALGVTGEFPALDRVDDAELVRRVRDLPGLPASTISIWREIDTQALAAPLARAVRLKLAAYRLGALKPSRIIRSSRRTLRAFFRRRRDRLE